MKKHEHHAKQIEYYRKQIDMCDRTIANLLFFRFIMAEGIGASKKKIKLGIIDEKRELEVINNIKKEINRISKTKKYSNKMIESFILNIFKDVLNYSKKIQSK